MIVLKEKLLNLSELISASFEAFQKAAVNMVLLNLLAYALCIPVFLVIIGIGAGAAFTSFSGAAISADMPPEVMSQMLFTNPLVILFILLTILFSVGIMAFITATNIVYAEHVVLDTPAMKLWDAIVKGFKLSFSVACNFFLLFIVWIAVMALLGGLGYLFYASESYGLLVLLVFLGLAGLMVLFFLSVYIMFFSQTIVLRGKTLLGAFKYSIDLVKNYYWLTVGYFLVIFVIISTFSAAINIVGMIINLIFGLLAAGNETAAIIINGLVSLLLLPIKVLPGILGTLSFTMLFLNRDFIINGGGSDDAKVDYSATVSVSDPNKTIPPSTSAPKPPKPDNKVETLDIN